MLGGAGDSTCDVELRSDDLAGLPDLVGSGYPAFLDCRSGGSHNASHNLRELFHKGKILLAAHSSSAGYDDLCFLEVDGLCDLFYCLNDLCADCVCGGVLSDDFAGSALV